MRLINTSDLKITNFIGSYVPRYGILSHTWVKGEEVTLQEFESSSSRDKPGFVKIEKFCAECVLWGLTWAWVDTCCIDKTDVVELSEAINSMFTWYRKAAVCFAYLRDVRWKVDPHAADISLTDMEIQRFTGCSWFTRGWTLQELLAPSRVVFFNSEWDKIGDRNSLQTFITEASGISGSYLRLKKDVGLACIAEKMSWASRRETTRQEDSAYCLIGLFGVNMPLIYGEGGTRAFIRLQEELIKSSADHTIFAWYIKTVAPNNTTKPCNGGSGLLAQTPKFFAHSGRVRRRLLQEPNDTHFLKLVSRDPYGMTNRGLQFQFLFNESWRCSDPKCSNSLARCRLGVLNCYFAEDPTSSIAIHIRPQQNHLYFDGNLWHISDGDVERTHLDQRTVAAMEGLLFRLDTVFVRRGDVTIDDIVEQGDINTIARAVKGTAFQKNSAEQETETPQTAERIVSNSHTILTPVEVTEQNSTCTEFHSNPFAQGFEFALETTSEAKHTEREINNNIWNPTVSLLGQDGGIGTGFLSKSPPISHGTHESDRSIIHAALKSNNPFRGARSDHEKDDLITL